MATPASPPSTVGFQPANTLANRTFIGLLVAQFLAAFNDQAIHASAMFFAFKTGVLNEAQAISLMPILFYAPWAIFCTLAGYYSDKYSKRYSLVIWKVSEILITGIALLGFYLGTHGYKQTGTWMVLGCVFLMGTHSAFFVPAKYGVMPEILQPHLLSRGNGILESLSFLAVILGTVAGGVLSEVFNRQEEYIGVVLLTLAIIGVLASFLIQKMPAANPTVKFPPYIYGPLIQNLKTLFLSKPLRLAVIGIAFFTFVVAFMRQTVYMLGESQNPRWGEQYTSIIVGTVALGIGFGSPLAGWLSGRKVELGLIPIGGFGMILFCLVAAANLSNIGWLIFCIIMIGFCTGFYLVPMYTLLQYRAPKSSKGNMIATSNFINVTGAIASSLLFFLLVTGARQTGFIPEITPTEGPTGILRGLEFDEHGHANRFRIESPEGELLKDVQGDDIAVHLGLTINDGMDVALSFYELAGVKHFLLREAGDPIPKAYDQRKLPEFLFIGAGLMTLVTLFVLLSVLPDLFHRAGWFLRSLRMMKARVDALKNLPGVGPVILATNAHEWSRQRAIIAATDRPTQFFTADELTDSIPTAVRLLEADGIVGVTVGTSAEDEKVQAFLTALTGQIKDAITIVPVFCGQASVPVPTGQKVLRVVFGESLPGTTSVDVIHRAVTSAQAMPME